MLALSATPGNDLDRVQEVIRNLGISNVELRNEDDAELRPYREERVVSEVIVDGEPKLLELSTQLSACVDYVLLFLKKSLVGRPEASLLGRCLVLPSYANNVQLYGCFKNNVRRYEESIGREGVSDCFDAFRLLTRLTTCRRALLEQGYDSLRAAKETLTASLTRRSAFCDGFTAGPLRALNDALSKDEWLAEHPKLAALKRLLRDFFDSPLSRERQSRAIVFTYDRQNARILQRALSTLSESIIAHIFIGQNSAQGPGMKQRVQAQTLERFRAGEINVLVATSVAEEGLDIGEVDLIVCYDSGLSPVRRVQRMGRTGRKRAGRVVMLLTPRELTVLRASQKKYRQLVEELRQAQRQARLQLPPSPRLFPAETQELNLVLVGEPDPAAQPSELHRLLDEVINAPSSASVSKAKSPRWAAPSKD